MVMPTTTTTTIAAAARKKHKNYKNKIHAKATFSSSTTTIATTSATTTATTATTPWANNSANLAHKPYNNNNNNNKKRNNKISKKIKNRHHRHAGMAPASSHTHPTANAADNLMDVHVDVDDYNNFTHNFLDLQNLIEINDFLTTANDSDGNNIVADAGSAELSSIIKLSNGAIMDTLLGSVMTTATASVAPKAAASAVAAATASVVSAATMATTATTTTTAAAAAATATAMTTAAVAVAATATTKTSATLAAAAASSSRAFNAITVTSTTAAAAAANPIFSANIIAAEPTAYYSNLLLDMSPATTSISAGVAAATRSYNDTTSYWEADRMEFDSLYRHSLSMSVVYIIAYVIVFLVGLIGNSFVIAVVLRAPRMRTVTNYFIVNLAIADILVIVFCLPATLISNIFVPWMLGWLMCKCVPYIQGVSVAASVYSLIAVSLDRFIAIWWPLKQMTKRRARFMILGIWVIALGTTIPWLLFFDLVPAEEIFPDAFTAPYTKPQYLCQEVWPPGTNGNLYFLLAHLVACYLLPMSLITLCYVLIWIKVSTRSIPGDSKDAQMDRMQQKSKVKVIKMLVAVVILFVLSWLPLYVIFARIKFGADISAEEFEVLKKVTPLAQWLGSSNSCINPILYAFFNKKYRRGFAAIIKSRSCCGRLRYYDNVAIASSTTSTRKSSHYHHNQNSSRKSPSSPGLRKANAVSYIYEHNSLRRHNLMMKQDSNLSQQMLLKQDSHGSRQFLIKQESASSEASSSRRLLCQQDSNGSKISLSKQDSIVSYMEAKQQRISQTGINIPERTLVDSVASTQLDNVSIDSRRGALLKQESLNMPLEYKRQKFVKQDSVISFVDQRPEPRRHQLVKQDSVISFADQRRGLLNKQDSIIANRSGDGHTVSILKKTDSQLSNGYASPRKNIDISE